jgi:hypothetical protein
MRKYYVDAPDVCTIPHLNESKQNIGSEVPAMCARDIALLRDWSHLGRCTYLQLMAHAHKQRRLRQSWIKNITDAVAAGLDQPHFQHFSEVF